MLKKLMILMCTGLLVISGCSKGNASNESNKTSTNASDESTSESTTGTDSSESNSDSSTENDSETASTSEQAQKEFEFEQLKPPEIGEEIAVIDTSMGTIKVRLFPKIAPKAVKNFKGLADDHKYDNLIFHRVINDFMIQSGDPNRDGTGGESIYGKSFEDEFDLNYRNFRGALCMANTGQPNTNGSQFFIVQAPADTISESLVNQMVETNKAENAKGSFSDEVVAEYKRLGGTPWLDFGHTVFGQVFEGMDVVDKIAGVETGENDKPITDVQLKTITIQKYGE